MSSPLEIELVQAHPPKRRLTLAEEEGESVGRRDEDMQYARPSRARVSDRPGCSFGQFAGVTAASNRLRANRRAGLEDEDPSDVGERGLNVPANVTFDVVSQADRDRHVRLRGVDLEHLGP